MPFEFIAFIALSRDVMPSSWPIRWTPFRTEVTTLGSAHFGKWAKCFWEAHLDLYLDRYHELGLFTHLADFDG